MKKKVIINFHAVKNFIEENNLTIKKFCELCNIKYYQYRQIQKNDLNIDIVAVLKVSKLIKLEMYKMFIYL